MTESKNPSVFISFRTVNGEGISAYFEDKLVEQGIEVLRISQQVDCPHPRGSVEEWDWFSKKLNAVIFGVPHIVLIASEAADPSQWVSWEILSSMGTARCLYICWVSGPDPRQWIAPLPRFAYWLFPIQSAFLIDGRDIISANPILRIGFPNLQTKILYGVSVLIHLIVAALSFYLARRALLAFGFPVDSYWNRVGSIMTAAFTAVLFFPRRAVFAYRAQRWKLRNVQLAFSGQTGTRAVLLIFLLAAVVTSLIIPIFHLTINRERISFAGLILLTLYTAFYHSYRRLVALPLSRLNARAMLRGAHRTMEELDEKRERAEREKRTSC